MTTIDLGDRVALIKADITSLNTQAKRCQFVTRTFLTTNEPLTEWDRRHADIDALLDSLARIP